MLVAVVARSTRPSCGCGAFTVLWSGVPRDCGFADGERDGPVARSPDRYPWRSAVRVDRSRPDDLDVARIGAGHGIVAQDLVKIAAVTALSSTHRKSTDADLTSRRARTGANRVLQSR